MELITTLLRCHSTLGGPASEQTRLGFKVTKEYRGVRHAHEPFAFECALNAKTNELGKLCETISLFSCRTEAGDVAAWHVLSCLLASRGRGSVASAAPCRSLSQTHFTGFTSQSLCDLLGGCSARGAGRWVAVSYPEAGTITTPRCAVTDKKITGHLPQSSNRARRIRRHGSVQDARNRGRFNSCAGHPNMSQRIYKSKSYTLARATTATPASS